MTKDELRVFLRKVKNGAITESEAVRKLVQLESESLGFATVDHHRRLRQGFPEVIFCQGKTPGQVAGIARSIAGRSHPLLATRADAKHFSALRRVVRGARFNAVARTITANAPEPPGENSRFILVVTAGTSDIPAAEEAVETIRMFGHNAETLHDVGVAGIHRLLSQSERLLEASVIIVTAGMEGALPSVVAGLVDVPVIAVPTSVGYGASFGGVTALLAMLNSCASGVTVVNIDNGFGAGFAASLMMGTGAVRR